MGSRWTNWYALSSSQGIDFGWLPTVGNGNEATLTDFASVVGEICYKNIVKISTCADSCFAITGVDYQLLQKQLNHVFINR